jgi:holliday junction DNA helicase RuvA
MIEYISGTLASKKPTEAVVDIQGLGYRLMIPMSTFESLPGKGKDVRLFCHQHVREDALLLFGFATASERALFNLFIGVSGIGPKLALAALSSLPASELKHRIRSGQADLLTRIPGVGKKTAQRIVIELRDRVDDGDAGAGSEHALDDRSSARADALAALEALGMSRNSADKSLTAVLNKQPDVESAEDLIRLALRS